MKGTGTEGLYASFDWFTSPPLLITRHPSAMLADVSSVAGDPNHVGRVIVGTSCAGWVKRHRGLRFQEVARVQVSVAMATYNGAKYLVSQLQSW